MMWRDRELTKDSWLMYTNRSHAVVRAGDIDPEDPDGKTHIDWVKLYPSTKMYYWPTTEELIKHFGEQPCKT